MENARPFDTNSYTGKGVCFGFLLFFFEGLHLKPTSDLTTEKFLAAFAQFVSRRWCPCQVQTDNGNTFAGAATFLSRDFLQSVKKSVTDASSAAQLAIFRPRAPHMGGLWEAGVKSYLPCRRTLPIC